MLALFLVAVAVTLAALWALARVWWTERRPGVLVLLYHRVRDEADWAACVGPERNFSIPADRLRDHLAWLRASGTRFLTLDEVYACATGRMPVPPRAACLTFDDGAESVHRLARPIWQGLDVPAAVFVTTDPGAWVFGDERRVTDDELRDLHRAGVAIGSHGVSHDGLRGLAPEALARELRSSRGALEAIVGPVEDLSLPLGFFDAAALSEARAAGYRMAFTARPGRVRGGDDLYRLRRLQVEGTTTLEAFQCAVEPATMAQRRVVGFLKRVPPRLLGERRWMPIRARLFASPLGRLLTFRGLRVIVAMAAALWFAAIAALGAAALG